MMKNELKTTLAIFMVLVFAIAMVYGILKTTIRDSPLPTGYFVKDSGQNPEREKISVRLSWLINSNQAGFLTAVKKGFYAEEGLDVTNRPGGIDFPSIQLVATGSDDFGVQSGAETLILARSNNIPVKAIAILDKKSPYVFFSLSENGIETPEDFEGKTVAVSYGRPLEVVYRVLLKKEGVDASTIKEVKKNPSDVLLFTGIVDVQPGFVSDFIYSSEKAKQNGKHLNVIRPADYGILSYGYTIFATEDMIENHPKLVEGYLRATLKGWRYAIEHPDEAIDYVLAENEKLDRGSQVKALKARKEFILPDNSETPPGWMEKEVWEEMQRNLVEQGILKEPIDVGETYTNEFLERIYSE